MAQREVRGIVSVQQAQRSFFVQVVIVATSEYAPQLSASCCLLSLSPSNYHETLYSSCAMWLCILL